MSDEQPPEEMDEGASPEQSPGVDDPLLRWDLERRESAKERHDERRAELAGRKFEPSADDADDELDIEAFVGAVAWAIEDEFAEQGRRLVVDVDALRALVERGEPPSWDELAPVLLVDQDELAQVMEQIRAQSAEGQSAEYVVALRAVSPADVLVHLVERALAAPPPSPPDPTGVD